MASQPETNDMVVTPKAVFECSWLLSTVKTPLEHLSLLPPEVGCSTCTFPRSILPVLLSMLPVASSCSASWIFIWMHLISRALPSCKRGWDSKSLVSVFESGTHRVRNSSNRKNVQYILGHREEGTCQMEREPKGLRAWILESHGPWFKTSSTTSPDSLWVSHSSLFPYL